MFECEQRFILLRFYLLGFIPIILTPSLLLYTADITINLSDNIRVFINLSLWFIGYYFIPIQIFWIADLRDNIDNFIDRKKFKKIKRSLIKCGCL